MTQKPLPEVLHTIAELRARSSELLELRAHSSRHASGGSGTAAGRPVLALVPTMGALHAGHAELVRRARGAADVVVASIFVNPLQFGDPADLERYPRTLDADVQVLAEAGADLVFAPSVEEMYPGGEPMVRLSAGVMGERFEGAARPGHFDGMLTVVSKLLNAAMPETRADYLALFGQKDAQQLAIIRRMVADLNMPVRIVGVPIVRDDDSLALSSRNVFLSAEERANALAIPRTLERLAAQAREGVMDLEAARAELASSPGIGLDYLELVDPRTFEPIDPRAGAGAGGAGAAGAGAERSGVVVVAARVGPVRLLDNLHL